MLRRTEFAPFYRAGPTRATATSLCRKVIQAMKREKLARGVFGGVALSIVAIAGAQISKQEHGYLFRMKFTKGESIHYLSLTDASGLGTPMKVSMTLDMKVLDVENGVGNVRWDLGQTLVNGKPFNLGQQMPKQATVKTDPRGQVQGGGIEPNTGSIVFPANRVPIGGTWSGSTEAPAGLGAGTMSLAANYKFVGIQAFSSFQVAKVIITLKASGKASMSGSGYVLLSMEDGSVVKNVMTVDLAIGAKSIPLVTTLSRK